MSERRLRAGLAFVAAFAVGYLLPGTLRLPVLLYHPLARAFSFGKEPGGVAMRYYGDLLAAFGVALACAAVAFWLPPRRASLAVATGAALSLVALDALFYLSRLFAAS